MEVKFSFTPLKGLFPLKVQFTNETIGSFAAAIWSFGDGVSRFELNPIYEYKSPGQYTPSLTVYCSEGTFRKVSPVPIVVTELSVARVIMLRHEGFDVPVGRRVSISYGGGTYEAEVIANINYLDG